jgi:hypothetical protein
MWKNYQLYCYGLGSGPYIAIDSDLVSEKFMSWLDKWRDHTHIDSTFYGEHELERYHQIMIHELHLCDEDVERWLTLLKSGYDEPLKAIIIALSEGLHDLLYVSYHNRAAGKAKRGPLDLLSSSIRNIFHFNSPASLKWPVGFRALRSVSMGELTQWRHQYDNFSVNTETIAPLFLLPAIEKLKLCLIGYDDPEVYVWEWEGGISTVKELELNDCDLEDETCVHRCMRGTQGFSTQARATTVLGSASRACKAFFRRDKA